MRRLLLEVMSQAFLLEAGGNGTVEALGNERERTEDGRGWRLGRFEAGTHAKQDGDP